MLFTGCERWDGSAGGRNREMGPGDDEQRATIELKGELRDSAGLHIRMRTLQDEVKAVRPSSVWQLRGEGFWGKPEG